MIVRFLFTLIAIAIWLAPNASGLGKGTQPEGDSTVQDWSSIPCCPDPAATQPPIDGFGDKARFGRELAGIAYDQADGYLYVADQEADEIRRVTPSGSVTTYAGDCDRNTTSGECEGDLKDGPRAVARFDGPNAIAYDPDDKSLYLTEFGDILDVRRIDSDGIVTTISGIHFEGVPISIAYDGRTSTMDVSDGYNVFQIATGRLLRILDLHNVFGMAYDAANQRLVLENLVSIAVIGANGTPKPLAGMCYKQADDKDPWTGCRSETIDGLGPSANFNHMQGLAFDDRDGDIYVADWNTIRRVSPTGQVSTIAGRRLAAEGNDDGLGSAASFGIASGLTYDSHEDALFVVDRANEEVRRLDLDGTVTTVAGSPKSAAPAIRDWSAEYDWPVAHEKLVVEVKKDQEMELFYKDGTLFEVRSGRRSAEYQSDFRLFSVKGQHKADFTDGFRRTGEFKGEPFEPAASQMETACAADIGSYAPSDGRISGGDSSFGKWRLQAATSTNCKALRVVDPDGKVDFQDYERSDIPHEPNTSWVRVR